MKMTTQTGGVIGPLQTGGVVLVTSIKDKSSKDDQLHVLRPDPNDNFPPYFGLLTCNNSGEFLLLNLTATLDVSPPTYTLLTGSMDGFAQNSTTNLIELTSNSGSFTYSYLNILGTSPMNVASGIPLLTFPPVALSVDSTELIFPSKTPAQEAQDKTNAQNPNYKPTYESTNIKAILFIPQDTRPSTNCSDINKNGALVSIIPNCSGDKETAFYTNEIWCKSKMAMPVFGVPLCPSGKVCGDMVSSDATDPNNNNKTLTCYGPCTSGNICTPVTKEKVSCQSPSATPSRTERTIIIVVVIISVLFILIIIALVIYSIARK